MKKPQKPFDTFVPFTFKGIRRLKFEGGTGDWVCSARRVMKCKYTLITHNKWGVPVNAENPEGIPTDRDVQRLPHRSAFMIGKVKSVSLSPWQPSDPAKKRRYRVEVSEWAILPEPLIEAWNKQRNPFRYALLSEFDIDLDALEWFDAAEAQREMAPFANEFSLQIDENVEDVENDDEEEEEETPASAPLNVIDEGHHGASLGRPVKEIIDELKAAIRAEKGDPKADVQISVKVVSATAFTY